jgi:hypothetical protein
VCVRDDEPRIVAASPMVDGRHAHVSLNARKRRQRAYSRVSGRSLDLRSRTVASCGFRRDRSLELPPGGA